MPDNEMGVIGAIRRSYYILPDTRFIELLSNLLENKEMFHYQKLVLCTGVDYLNYLANPDFQGISSKFKTSRFKLIFIPPLFG